VLGSGTGAGQVLLLVYNEERGCNEDYNEDKHIKIYPSCNFLIV